MPSDAPLTTNWKQRLPLGRMLLALAALVATACFERGGREERAAVPPPAPVAALADGWLAAEPRGAPDPAATLRVALDAEPATLDPFATLDAASARVLSQVVEGLACPTADGGVEPCVARAWRVAPDGRTWRFTLDPHRRFADGAPITASISAGVAFQKSQVTDHGR
mgnify:CR=1 FL=1